MDAIQKGENAWRQKRILKVQTVVPSVHSTARHDLLPETRIADFLQKSRDQHGLDCRNGHKGVFHSFILCFGIAPITRQECLKRLEAAQQQQVG
jgi:hypothetical protein